MVIIYGMRQYITSNSVGNEDGEIFVPATNDNLYIA